MRSSVHFNARRAARSLLLKDNHLEQSRSENDDEIDDGFYEGFESPPGTSQSTSGTSYPPKQETAVLVKMFQYFYRHSAKRIPVNIPSNYARSGHISDLPGPD
ncbi:Hypothetical predicted protein [Paramuricea clavata]|uniref:Uncharacterized protein n=1 Tax=Paramuricea clavata TaxID=317549 RepID=A0A7D9E9Z9_PARCT|nr:Hypothetical predicted protein [Paramuricea clavata]